MLNIITMMGEHHRQSDEFTAGLNVLNYIFTVLFIIEAILRLLALKLEYFKSGWNLFDFTIVIFSITGWCDFDYCMRTKIVFHVLNVQLLSESRINRCFLIITCTN